MGVGNACGWVWVVPSTYRHIQPPSPLPCAGRTGRCGKTGVATTFINKNQSEAILLDLKHVLIEVRTANHRSSTRHSTLLGALTNSLTQPTHSLTHSLTRFRISDTAIWEGAVEVLVVAL